jgi:hypothetical protein
MATALNDASGGTSQAAVGYFVDQKKGEVNELKQVLLLSTFNFSFYVYYLSAIKKHQCRA